MRNFLHFRSVISEKSTTHHEHAYEFIKLDFRIKCIFFVWFITLHLFFSKSCSMHLFWKSNKSFFFLLFFNTYKTTKRNSQNFSSVFNSIKSLVFHSRVKCRVRTIIAYQESNISQTANREPDCNRIALLHGKMKNQAWSKLGRRNSSVARKPFLNVLKFERLMNSTL